MSSKKYTVDIFTMGYNEEYLLPHFVNFYKTRFNDCTITYIDNFSTDFSKKLAQELGCKVDDIDTGGQIRDDILLDVKNNYWKKSTADWIIVCDVDEWVELWQNDLDTNNSFFRSIGYDMIGDVDTQYGVRNPLYDKICCFNRHKIKEIGYQYGAHHAFPKGNIRESPKRPNLYHMRYLSPEILIERYENYKNRLSEFNLEKGFCGQYHTSKKLLLEKYQYLDKVKIKIR